MKATTEDWTLAAQRSARWRVAEQRAAIGDMNCQCLLDLRRRVEALEQRATTEESSVPEPAAPPLWEVMDRAFYDNGGQNHDDWVATINTVAEWLAARGCADSADMLHAEARRAREGA